MQNTATSQRTALHKKTKTKTQFKREFLKSEDVARQKDNLERLPGACAGARGAATLRPDRPARVCLCYCELLFRSLL